MKLVKCTPFKNIYRPLFTTQIGCPSFFRGNYD